MELLAEALEAGDAPAVMCHVPIASLLFDNSKVIYGDREGMPHQIVFGAGFTSMCKGLGMDISAGCGDGGAVQGRDSRHAQKQSVRGTDYRRRALALVRFIARDAALLPHQHEFTGDSSQYKFFVKNVMRAVPSYLDASRRGYEAYNELIPGEGVNAEASGWLLGPLPQVVEMHAPAPLKCVPAPTPRAAPTRELTARPSPSDSTEHVGALRPTTSWSLEPFTTEERPYICSFYENEVKPWCMAVWDEAPCTGDTIK